MNIRLAETEDVERMLAIYSPYILETAITFEYEIPSYDEFLKRFITYTKRYPWIVAEDEDGIIGYAYATQFHTREAYEHGAELSIYVDMNKRLRGVGSLLYNEIIKLLIKQNVLSVYACIATIDDEDDPYLTNASVRFHEKEGFFISGTHKKCGYKFGRWYDVVWMEKVVNDCFDNPEKFIPFPDIK